MMKYTGTTIRREHSRKGFTMIELLVVVMIIMMLTSVLVVAIRPNVSQSLSSAQRSLQSLLQSARTTAIMRGVPTRLLIHAEAPSGISDENNTAKYLRYMGVVALEDSNGNGEVDPGEDWLPVNRGTFLPQNIYFVPEGSGMYVGSMSGSLTSPDKESSRLGGPSTMDFPSSAETGSYHYLQFDATGMIDSDEHSDPFASLVVAPGSLNEVTGDPEINRDESAFTVTDMFVRRYGNVVMYTDVEMIP